MNVSGQLSISCPTTNLLAGAGVNAAEIRFDKADNPNVPLSVAVPGGATASLSSNGNITFYFASNSSAGLSIVNSNPAAGTAMLSVDTAGGGIYVQSNGTDIGIGSGVKLTSDLSSNGLLINFSNSAGIHNNGIISAGRGNLTVNAYSNLSFSGDGEYRTSGG